MGIEDIRFSRNRRLVICSLSSGLQIINDSLSSVFVAMLPAFDRRELEVSIDISILLLNVGCLEFCFVGEKSENLHDDLDHLLEDRGLTGIVTTWHDDASDACEYFVNASGGGADCLIALIEGHDQVVAELRREVAEIESR